MVNGKEIDTTFNHQINQVFGNLDKGRVTFGILKDYALELTNLQGYNGTDMADSTILSKPIFYEIYNTLVTARVTTTAYNTLPNPAVTDSIWYTYRQPGQVALCGLFYQYAYLDANALSNNAITVNNNQYFDKYINGVWQNPYLTGKTLGFTPATANYLGQSFNILLPGNLWLSNSKNIVDHIEIDAGDGQGYQTLTPDTPLPVSYADTGIKVWNFKLYLTDNTVLQSHTRLQVIADVYNQNVVDNNRSSRNATTQAVSQGNDPNFFLVTSTETYNGYPASGYVTVKLAAGHTNIQKPLIVVEGFDPGRLTKPESFIGESSLNIFNSDLARSSTLQSLVDSQYDVIYVDYYNGLDYIQRNALLVKEVIRWVNSQKATNGSTEKNVIIGQSMGGLVARYALKKMEDASETHDTRLYISDDSPQQGANVPVGLQYLVNHARSLYARAGVGALLYDVVALFIGGNNPVPGYLDVRNSPAAMQMLTNYIDVSGNLNTSVHDAWQTELTSLGYPAQGNIRNIAISNGSECAKPADVAGNAQIILVDGQFKTSLLTEILSAVATVLAPVAATEVYGGIATATGQPALLLGLLPGGNKINLHFEVNASDNNSNNQVYHGYINYTKSLWWIVNFTVSMTNVSKNKPAGMFAYDKFPGSYVDVGSISSPSTANWFYSYHVTVTGPAKFCFIPVPSALDISGSAGNLSQSDYSVAYVGANPPSAPKATPFANFITAFANGGGFNEGHISFESRNGNWLANELNTAPTTAGCNYFCNNQSISGNSNVCNTPTAYSVGSSSSVSFYWDVSQNLQIISGQNTNSISVLPGGTGVGQGTITLHMYNTQCGSVTVTKQVNVGGPVDFYNVQKFDNNTQFCANAFGNTMTVEPQNISDITYFEWGYTDNVNPPVVVNSHGGYYQDFVFPAAGTYQIYARAGNDCGLGITRTCNVSVSDDCGGGGFGGFMAYPNPAGDQMTITSASSPSASDNAVMTTTRSSNTPAFANIRRPFSYKLYNKQGKIVKQGLTDATTDAVVDTHDLTADSYFLHVFIGKAEYQRQIIIKH